MKPKLASTTALFILLLFNVITARAQDPMIGEIRLFAGNFAPRGWALCQGQLLSISQNNALFSILGTTYGGDGRTTFALPDLRGRVPIGNGQGPGLTNVTLGRKSGTENITISTSQLPSHNHRVNGLAEMNIGVSPNSKTLTRVFVRGGTTGSTAASDLITTATGSSSRLSNNQPSVGLNYIIALQGIYPSRN